MTSLDEAKRNPDFVVYLGLRTAWKDTTVFNLFPLVSFSVHVLTYWLNAYLLFML